MSIRYIILTFILSIQYMYTLEVSFLNMHQQLLLLNQNVRMRSVMVETRLKRSLLQKSGCIDLNVEHVKQRYAEAEEAAGMPIQDGHLAPSVWLSGKKYVLDEKQKNSLFALWELIAALVDSVSCALTRKKIAPINAHTIPEFYELCDTLESALPLIDTASGRLTLNGFQLIRMWNALTDIDLTDDGEVDELQDFLKKYPDAFFWIEYFPLINDYSSQDHLLNFVLEVLFGISEETLIESDAYKNVNSVIKGYGAQNKGTYRRFVSAIREYSNRVVKKYPIMKVALYRSF